MFKGKLTMVVAVCLMTVLGLAGTVCADFSSKELDSEKLAVTFAKEVDRGNYKIVTTPELKEWIDQKKNMLIIDTMPYEASYKKNHIPGALPMEFPIPEMTTIDDAKKAELMKLLGPDKNRLIVFYCGFTT